MKTASLFLLLSVLAYVGWGVHAERKQQEQKASQGVHDRLDGYERCVGALDESWAKYLSDSAPNPKWNNQNAEAKEIERAWLKARDGCRDFWISGKSTGGK